MRLAELKAVLLDMDGVVAESMGYHVAAWQEAFRAHGFEVAADILYLNEGGIAVETVRSLNGGSLSEQKAREVFSLQKAIFDERYLPQVGLYADAPLFLEGLRLAGLEAALVSGSSERTVLGVLKPGVRCYFSAVICGDRCRHSKPHPDPYLQALEALGREAAECVAVENSPAGIESARAAGLTCYALTTTLPADRLRGAAAVFGSLTQLARHLGLPR